MIVGKADRPSVKSNEVNSLQPSLADLLRSFTLVLLPSLRIAQWIGYALPLRYVSSFSLKPAISRTFVALARTRIDHGCGVFAHASPSDIFFKSPPETRNDMNETSILPSRKKQPSEAVLVNGKPGRQKTRHIPSKDSPRLIRG